MAIIIISIYELSNKYSNIGFFSNRGNMKKYIFLAVIIFFNNINIIYCAQEADPQDALILLIEAAEQLEHEQNEEYGQELNDSEFDALEDDEVLLSDEDYSEKSSNLSYFDEPSDDSDYEPAKKRNRHKTYLKPNQIQEGTFICDQCNKSYIRKNSFLRHRRSHVEEKKYKCGILECPKVFREKHHLETHMRLHYGEKPFVCPKCGKLFSDKSNCTQHIKTHKR